MTKPIEIIFDSEDSQNLFFFRGGGAERVLCEVSIWSLQRPNNKNLSWYILKTIFISIFSPIIMNDQKINFYKFLAFFF